MTKKTRFDTESDASAFVGLLQIWDSVKSFDTVSKYAFSLGFKEEEIFLGYIYFIDTWLRAFLEELRLCKQIPLKDNYELYRASYNGIPITEISNSCEKIIFIRNYYKLMQELKRSKNKNSLSLVINKFNTFISAFVSQFNTRIYENKDISLYKKDRIRFSTISRGLFVFNQFIRVIPSGRYFHLFKIGASKQELQNSFLGYKITLLYMWKKCLTKTQFKFVKEIKDAIDWTEESYVNKYLLEHPEKFESEQSKLFADMSITIPGNTIDCFFRIIIDKIIRPLEKNKNVNIGFDVYFMFREDMPKHIFKAFLEDKPPTLTDENKIGELFLWYPSEVIDSAKRNIFNGAAAFMVVLEGAVRLSKRMGNTNQVQILKISHTVGENQHDYTYGVLIESGGSFGSDWSGWMVFYDVCGDYSGFSGQEHAYIESLINTHLKNNSITLRERAINKNKIEEYLSKSSTERIIGQITNEHKKRKEILNEARGMIIELLVYYLQTQIKGQVVKWAIGNKKEGDIDILVEKGQIIKFIECKLTPRSYDISEEIKKIRKKRDNYKTHKHKTIEFWFWFEPDPDTKQRLKSMKIEYHLVLKELSNQPNYSSRRGKVELILNSH